MDLDRPHYHTTSNNNTASELLICFASRLSSSSSSSMKLSKPILSPSRSRDAPLSLSTSLSRRLRTNGSLRAGQASPMFPTGGKKRGSGSENPEPSSPKVTCIGQVRVKTKKKVKQSRSLSRRRSGDVSFRKLEQSHEALNQNEDKMSLQNQRYLQRSSSVHYQSQECVPHRNQRWVHLPLTICEALRGFGAEFSCLFPCRSSCFATNDGEKEDRLNASREGGNNGQSSCGAVFGWLVALQDGEAGKVREIDLVVPSNEEERTRRHVFEDIVFKDETVELEEGVKEEKARVSICVPPKNALLMMRCRSDPMKLTALANRFCESPDPKDEDADDQEELDKDENGGIEQVGIVDCQKCESSNEIEVTAERSVSVDLDEIEEYPEAAEVGEIEEENTEQEKHEANQENGELAAGTEYEEGKEETNVEPIVAEFESHEQSSHGLVHQTTEDTEDNQVLEPEEEGEEDEVTIDSSGSKSSETEDQAEAALEEEEEVRFISAIEKEIIETLLMQNIQENPTLTQQESQLEPIMQESLLMMMMCEPKLSMEVSKETWVCSTDFLRHLPETTKHVKATKKEEVSEEPNNHMNQQHLLQPPRSSCSAANVAGKSMTTMIEHRLVLTRCKSEPKRTAAAAAKLVPDACFWKNKVEPHQPATFGVGGAAGVGF